MSDATPDTAAAEIVPGAAPMPPPPEDPFACPDFDSMKVPDINAWAVENAASIEAKGGIAGFEKMKAAEKRANLKSLFDALSSPEVTGLDPNDAVSVVTADAEALKTPEEAEAALMEIADDAQFSYFKAGAILCAMQTQDWHPGFEKFFEYVTATFGFRLRKAQTLMQIYRAVTGRELTWADIEPLGWGKMAALAGVLDRVKTYEAALGVLKKSMGLTHAGVVELAKTLNAVADDDSQTETTSNVTKMTFPVFNEQKELVEAALEKAGTEGNTDHKGRKLELICTSFLAGGTVVVKGKASKVSLEDQITGLAEGDNIAENQMVGLTRVFEAVDAAYPSLDFDVFPAGKDARTALGYLIEFCAQEGPEEMDQQMFENLVGVYTGLGGDTADLTLEAEEPKTAEV